VFGSINNPNPIIIISKKLITNKRAGGTLNEFIPYKNLFISDNNIRIEITIKGISPEKILSDPLFI
jgi:hypothetical protein